MGTSGLRKTGWLEQALGGLERLAHRRGRAKDLPAHLKVGTKGEDATFFYLRRKGYTVVARRWTSGDVPGDIDLIAWQGPMLCFIEVKSRSERTITPAEVAVDEHKRNVTALGPSLRAPVTSKSGSTGSLRCHKCVLGSAHF